MKVRELIKRLEDTLNDPENTKEEIENMEVFINIGSHKYLVESAHQEYSEANKELTFEIFNYR